MSNNIFKVNNQNSNDRGNYSSFTHLQQFAPHLLNEQNDIENNKEYKIGLPPPPEHDNTFDLQLQKEENKLMAPTVLLTGHTGEIHCLKFATQGRLLASAGFDKLIFLWDIYNQCQNYMTMRGHKGCILDFNFSSDSTKIVSNSSDKTVQIYDVEQGKRIKKLMGHSLQVNSSSISDKGLNLIASASDDNNLLIWDPRQKQAIDKLETDYPLTSCIVGQQGDKVFVGGIDNQIKEYCIRQRRVTGLLLGHMDTITAMALSHDGSYLLSNSMDQTIRCWDIRPFVSESRCVKIFQGHQHNYEKQLLKVSWSVDGQMISAGSSDKMVYIWDTTTKRILQRLAGHQATVNDVQFSPLDSQIVASCSTDRNIIIGHLPSHSL